MNTVLAIVGLAALTLTGCAGHTHALAPASGNPSVTVGTFSHEGRGAPAMLLEVGGRRFTAQGFAIRRDTNRSVSQQHDSRRRRHSGIAAGSDSETEFVSGASAARSGRVPGWDLADRDLVRIDANTLGVSYTSGLMNIGMAVAVRPGDGRVTVVGTDARNEIRFEPNVRGRFVRVLLANVEGGGAAGAIDLNPQLDDSGNAVSAALRAQALGDPRGIAWSADGRRGYVAGLGSNNVVVLGASGARAGSVAPIEVGEGPTGLALDERHRVLYVWNHFEASLAAIDTQTLRERSRLAVYSPLPAAIRDGRRFLYDTLVVNDQSDKV